MLKRAEMEAGLKTRSLRKIIGFLSLLPRADTLVWFAVGSLENGLLMPKWSVFGLFFPPKVLFHTWNMHV